MAVLELRKSAGSRRWPGRRNRGHHLALDCEDAVLLLTAEAFAQAIVSEVGAEAARQQSAFLLQVAQAATQTRDDVLAVASHELRTPLTPLKLRLHKAQQILARSGERPDRDELARALRGTDRYLDRLVGFFDGLVDVSRVVRDPLDLALAPVSLAEIVRRGIEWSPQRPGTREM